MEIKCQYITKNNQIINTSYIEYRDIIEIIKNNYLLSMKYPTYTKKLFLLDDIDYDESLINELTEAIPQNYLTQISVRKKIIHQKIWWFCFHRP